MTKKITDNLFYLFIFILPWQTVFILREPMIDGEKWQYGTIGIYLTDIILVLWIILLLGGKFRKVTSNFPASPAGRQFLSPRLTSLGLATLKCLFGNRRESYNLKLKNLRSYKFNRKSYLYLLLATCYLLLTWSFLSILWSPDKALAFYFSLQLLLGVGLFFVLQKIKINWKKIIFVFLAAAVLQSALALGQFTFQESFSNKWLGMNNYETWRGGVSVLENEGGRWLRAYGSLPHPNILGGYLAIVFLLGIIAINNKQRGVTSVSFPRKRKYNPPARLAVVLAERAGEAGIKSPVSEINLDSRFRGNDIRKNRVNYFFILNGLLIILLGIFLTFSRGAWLALVIGIIFLGASVWLSTVPSERDQSVRKNFIKLLLIFILAGIIFAGINHENFSTRFNVEKRLEQKSISERSLYFNQAKEIIKENFWLGVGAGNYTWAVLKNDEIEKPIWQYQPVHNVFMLIWAELGIIGLILFLTALIIFLIKSNYQFRFLLIAFCLLLLLDHWLWTTHFGILLFWLIAGLAVRSYSMEQELNKA